MQHLDDRDEYTKLDGDGQRRYRDEHDRREYDWKRCDRHQHARDLDAHHRGFVESNQLGHHHDDVNLVIGDTDHRHDAE